jgi:hypothetical protein
MAGSNKKGDRTGATPDDGVSTKDILMVVQTLAKRQAKHEDETAGDVHDLSKSVAKLIELYSGGIDNMGKGLLQEVKELSFMQAQSLKEISRLTSSIEKLVEKQNSAFEHIMEHEGKIARLEPLTEIVNTLVERTAVLEDWKEDLLEDRVAKAEEAQALAERKAEEAAAKGKKDKKDAEEGAGKVEVVKAFLGSSKALEIAAKGAGIVATGVAGLWAAWPSISEKLFK